jgi:hypothetical protein
MRLVADSIGKTCGCTIPLNSYVNCLDSEFKWNLKGRFCGRRLRVVDWVRGWGRLAWFAGAVGKGLAFAANLLGSVIDECGDQFGKGLAFAANLLGCGWK